MASVTDVSIRSLPGQRVQRGKTVDVEVTIDTGTTLALDCDLTLTDNLRALINRTVRLAGPTATRTFSFTVPDVDTWEVCASVGDCAPVTGFSPNGGATAQQAGGGSERCDTANAVPPFDPEQISLSCPSLSAETVVAGTDVNGTVTVENNNPPDAPVPVITTVLVVANKQGQAGGDNPTEFISVQQELPGGESIDLPFTFETSGLSGGVYDMNAVLDTIIAPDGDRFGGPVVTCGSLKVFTDQAVSVMDCRFSPRNISLGDTITTTATIENANPIPATVDVRWFTPNFSNPGFVDLQTVTIAGNTTREVEGEILIRRDVWERIGRPQNINIDVELPRKSPA